MTATEVAKAVSSLSRIQPGYLPADLFYELARLVALTAVELVPVSMDESGKVWVLLLRRSNDDPFWPSKLHTPGSIVRATDAGPDFADAFLRIINGELCGAELCPPTFVCNAILNSKRGTAVSIVHYAEVIRVDKVGEFYPIDRLPYDLIPDQREFIEEAARSFSATLELTSLTSDNAR